MRKKKLNASIMPIAPVILFYLFESFSVLYDVPAKAIRLPLVNA